MSLFPFFRVSTVIRQPRDAGVATSKGTASLAAKKEDEYSLKVVFLAERAREKVLTFLVLFAQSELPQSINAMSSESLRLDDLY